MTVATGDRRTSQEQVEQAIAELKTLLGARTTTGAAVRNHHAHGEGYHLPAPPDVVCFPHSTAEVSDILKISAKFQVPVIPFGAGTSVEGHVNAIRGGICIDLREMDQVLQVSPENFDVTVQAGVTREQLTKRLKSTGCTFFIDPGADATIGGMAATRASGTTAVRYGTMRDNVLALSVVMADGRIIKTGTRARKSSSGYDLTRLFVGSEGTLGVITEVTLRLHAIPEAISAAVCSFATVRGAVETVIETIQLGVPVARIELLDELAMEAVNRYSKLNYPVTPTLFFEFHGSSDQHLAEQSSLAQSLAEEHGGRQFQWATKREERDKLWAARHSGRDAIAALRPGCTELVTDVCVPIASLADFILETKKDAAQMPFPTPIAGHVGDGNFHLACILDPNSEAELAQAKQLAERIVLRALAAGGTCTGEHGVGLGKMKYLEAEHGPALDVMRAIKRALDPDNRMNPGKMLEP